MAVAGILFSILSISQLLLKAYINFHVNILLTNFSQLLLKYFVNFYMLAER